MLFRRKIQKNSNLEIFFDEKFGGLFFFFFDLHVSAFNANVILA